MNFDLTEEQAAIRDAAKDFAETEIAPTSVERDLTGDFPAEIVKKLGELGFMGMMVAPEWGGAGMDTLSYVLAIEEKSKVDASVGVIMSVNNKEKYLKPLASGQMLGAFCLSEPEAGSDATQQRTEAILEGDHYVLNGMKNWITNGTQADVYFLQAMTDRSKGYKGISTFIVDKNSPGIEVGKKEDKMGIRSSDTCTLGLNNVKVPKENILGEEGIGFKIAMSTLNGGRIGVAAQALGIARASYEASVKYSKQRKAFDSTISNLQAIQFKLADMATSVEAASLLVYRAAKNKDEGKSYIKEASMGKLLASKAAVECSLEAIQVHGGYGYVREYLVERYMRDSKITQIYEGTSEIQKLVIARELLKG